MKRLTMFKATPKSVTRVTLALAAALCLNQSLAVTRGGQMVYGRSAEKRSARNFSVSAAA